MTQHDRRSLFSPSTRIDPQIVQDFAVALTRLLEAVFTPGPSSQGSNAPDLIEEPMGFKRDRRLLYTAKEAAQVLGFGVNTVYQLTYTPDFPKIRIGRRILIPAKGLEEWLQRQIGGQIDRGPLEAQRRAQIDAGRGR